MLKDMGSERGILSHCMSWGVAGAFLFDAVCRERLGSSCGRWPTFGGRSIGLLTDKQPL